MPNLPQCPRSLAPPCPEEVFCSHLLKEGRKRMEERERERKEMVWWQRRKTCRTGVSWGNRFTVCYSGTSFSMSVNYSGLPSIHTASPQASACSLNWSQGLPQKDEKKKEKKCDGRNEKGGGRKWKRRLGVLESWLQSLHCMVRPDFGEQANWYSP